MRGRGRVQFGAVLRPSAARAGSLRRDLPRLNRPDLLPDRLFTWRFVASEELCASPGGAMPEMPSYEPGAPSWVELASPDVRLSRRFYQGLFGWGSYTLTDAQVAAYEVFTLGGTADGPPIAGLDALADPAAEPTWTCYFRVVDAAAAAAAVVEAGGQVMAEPTDAGHLGRMV